MCTERCRRRNVTNYNCVTKHTNTKTYAEALNDVFHQEMKKDKSIILLGQDIGVLGGREGVTKNLLKKFGRHRVIDAPLNEELYVGIAIGAAQMGMRPVIEFAHSTLSLLAFADVFRSGIWCGANDNAFSLPIVIRLRHISHMGPELSPYILSILALFQGVTVVAPSTPQEAQDILRGALRSSQPVIIF